MNQLHPFFDLGDQIVIDGKTRTINGFRMYFSSEIITDLWSPGGDELDDEFAFKSPVQRQLGRSVQTDSDMGLSFNGEEWVFDGLIPGGGGLPPGGVPGQVLTKITPDDGAAGWADSLKDIGGWDALKITDAGFTVTVGSKTYTFTTPTDAQGQIIAVNGMGKNRTVQYG